MSKNYVNYSRIVDEIENIIDIEKAKNKSITETLKEVRKYLASFLFTKNDYGKLINRRLLVQIDKYTQVFTGEQMIDFIQRTLRYNSDLTDRQKVMNVFTVVENWFDPKSLEDYKVNIKEIMKPL